MTYYPLATRPDYRVNACREYGNARVFSPGSRLRRDAARHAPAAIPGERFAILSSVMTPALLVLLVLPAAIIALAFLVAHLARPLRKDRQ